MADLLSEAIQSVVAQSYNNWELIIVDNNSTDHTTEVIKKYEDIRIKTIKINNHNIIAKSRNAGLHIAQGDWVTFLDSDDVWYPHRLETIVECIKSNNQYDIISTNEMLINTSSGYKKKLIYGKKRLDNLYFSLLIYGNLLSPSATAVKTKFIKKNLILFRENHEFITAEDYDFWLLLAKHQANLISLDTVLGEYRVHKNNTSIKNDLHRINVQNVIFDHLKNLDLHTKQKKNLKNKINSRLTLTDAKINLENGKILLGLSNLFTSLTKSPLFFFKT